MGKFIDLTGQKFGRLTVLERVKNDKNNRAQWKCMCNCSNKNEIIVNSNSLKTGNTQSCGCFKKEISKEIKTIHGMDETRTYLAWKKMKQRCLNPKSQNYKYYGGRCISICNDWLKFENFYRDMGDCPDDYSLERINNNGNYCKENCKWATIKEQARNRRNNKFVEFNGEIKTLAEWSEILGIKQKTLSERLIDGWTVEQCFGYESRNGKYYYPPNLIGSGLLES